MKSILHINGKLDGNARLIDRLKIEEKATEALRKANNLNFDKINEDARVIEKSINGKKRKLRRMWPFETENIISVYLKFVLDKQFNIKYPNRSKIIKELTNALYLTKDLTTYTIYKFDFKDYFNSISTTDIYKQIISGNVKKRNEEDILNKYCGCIEKCYQGLPLSNAISEIAGKKFDNELLKNIGKSKVIFYRRYVDDCLLILNRYIRDSDVEDMVYSAIKEVFGENLELNHDKVQYISSKDLVNSESLELDYLGYLFTLSIRGNSLKIQYGITESKIKKYRSLIDLIVNSYMKNKDVELLRHRLKAFCSRIVTMDSTCCTCKWKSKGFINNYGELRMHIDEIDEKTINFLKIASKNHSPTEILDFRIFLKHIIRKAGIL